MNENWQLKIAIVKVQNGNTIAWQKKMMSFNITWCLSR